MSKLPGNYDSLHAKLLYPSTNTYQIPDLLGQTHLLTPPFDLLPYRYGENLHTERPVLIHFHTEDRRFESVWHEPSRGVRSGQRAGVWAMCSPDFSLWSHYPLAMQIWNTYRNRWLGRHWQEQGICVIPTVNWSIGASYDFAFLGIPKYQLITLRTYGGSSRMEQAAFTAGYQRMIEVLEPSGILWFGPQVAEVFDDPIEKWVYPVGFGQEEW